MTTQLTNDRLEQLWSKSIDDRSVLIGSDLRELIGEVRRLRMRVAKLRDVLTWTEDNCPGRCAGVVRDALTADAS